MVNRIGIKAVMGVERGIAPVVRVAAAPIAQPVAEPADSAPAAPQLTVLARDLAAQPPVDLERVAKIKKAVTEGHFPICPAIIADRLIALKYDWKPHDDAA
ncbi:MAG: flagellar biosynthesis anti-sigma factor FlgM [Sphingomonas sp.]